MQPTNHHPGSLSQLDSVKLVGNLASWQDIFFPGTRGANQQVRSTIFCVAQMQACPNFFCKFTQHQVQANSKYNAKYVQPSPTTVIINTLIQSNAASNLVLLVLYFAWMQACPIFFTKYKRSFSFTPYPHCLVKKLDKEKELYNILMMYRPLRSLFQEFSFFTHFLICPLSSVESPRDS